MERIIGLMDLDYFYAQCEILRKPEIKGKPVVIVMPSLREGSGAIATCNYEARALKIKSGMPLSLAKKLSNSETVFINADKPYYLEVSQKVFEILDFFCEKVEQVSVDEAYFDLTNPQGFDKAVEICQKIKQRIFLDLGLTCSIGLSTNKLVAKMASSEKKPDGFFIVKGSEVDSFLLKHSVTDLFGVGPKTEELLRKKGIWSISGARNYPKSFFVELIGEANGAKLFDFIFGIDNREVEPNREKQQLSRMMTIKEDSRDFEIIMQNINFLAEMLYKEITSLKKNFKTVSLIIVNEKMETITKSRTAAQPINSFEELVLIESELLKSFLSESQSMVRRVGVRVSNFDADLGLQRKLFEF